MKLRWSTLQHVVADEEDEHASRDPERGERDTEELEDGFAKHAG